MSKLPTSLWGAINRAKLDLRKFHLEQDPKKKEKLRILAIASMANADKQVGPGPHKFLRSSSRHLWRNEILYLSNGDMTDDARGPYWQDSVEHWSLDTLPEWARNQSVKVQEPTVGTIITVQGKPCHYKGHPIYDHDR